MKKRFFSIILIFLFIFLIGCSKENSKDTVKNLEDDNESQEVSGNYFIDFEGETLEGKTITQDIFSENKLTMVNVWGTNCGPCIHEIPYLEEIDDELKSEGFKLIGVIADGITAKESAKEILSSSEADYMNIFLNSSDMVKLKVQYVPTTFLVNSQGKILEDPIVGALSKEDYMKKIKSYLE